MATKELIDKLAQVAGLINGIDKDKLYRKSIGEESFEPKIKPLLEDIAEKLSVALENSGLVSNEAVSNAATYFSQIATNLNAQANRNNQEYIAQKQNCLNAINNSLNALLQWWPQFVIAEIQRRGILSDDGLEEEHQRIISTLKKESETSLAALRAETKKVIEEAKTLASEIESGARRTAVKISVSDAQNQFSDAKHSLLWQIAIWASLSFLVAVGLGGLIYLFANEILPSQWTWQIGYTAAIHFAALTALASLLAYCLSILRAQLHMFNHNDHRLRVTNSMEAFIHSAITSEQRDFILARLVEEVASFGNSGLVKTDQDKGSKIIIDPISKILRQNRSDD